MLEILSKEFDASGSENIMAQNHQKRLFTKYKSFKNLNKHDISRFLSVKYTQAVYNHCTGLMDRNGGMDY